jgi:phospholipid/cholesterol/gamma-HCH transport system substrate-binding protein
MERNANYALVGFASLLLFIGLLVFVVWLARLQSAKDYDLYDILFVGPVRGLSVGGEVHFNGIKVGEVTKIDLDPVDPNRVIAAIRITAKVPIRVDSYATLEPQGITGVNYVQITAGTPTLKLLKDVTPPGVKPVIKSQRSALADLLEGGGTVLTRTIEALDRVNKVLSDKNIAAFSSTLHNVQDVTAALAAKKGILDDATKTLNDIDQTAQNFSALAKSGQSLVDNDGKRALKQLGDAADELKAATADVRKLIAKLQGPTTDFATTGLPQLTSAIGSLQQTVESLDRLVNEIQQNPRMLVTKPPAKEVEVKP